MTLIKNKATQTHIAYFITPHGFGHAGRAAAIMSALHEIKPDIHFDIFTRVPEWFFEESVGVNFTYHSFLTDIGMVQSTPLSEDLTSTLKNLDNFYPLDDQILSSFVEIIKNLHCRLIICDIAPLGIAVAQKSGIPSVLVENFTWDWIYQGYLDEEPALERHINYLHHLFTNANYNVQTDPVCLLSSHADLHTPPISRKPRNSRSVIRERLKVGSSDKLVLLSMGGIQDELKLFQHWTKEYNFYLVIPGGSSTSMEVHNNMILLPPHSDFYHPDLIYAVDLVIGKAGYSTMAETYQSGIGFAYITRPKFRESEVLAHFIQENIPCIEISQVDFETGAWFLKINPLLNLNPIKRNTPNGVDEAAQFLIYLLES